MLQTTLTQFSQRVYDVNFCFRPFTWLIKLVHSFLCKMGISLCSFLLGRQNFKKYWRSSEFEFCMSVTGIINPPQWRQVSSASPISPKIIIGWVFIRTHVGVVIFCGCNFRIKLSWWNLGPRDKDWAKISLSRLGSASDVCISLLWVSQYIRETYGHTERKGHPQIAWKLEETVSKL